MYERWRDVMPCHLSVQDKELRIVEGNDLFKKDFGDRVGEFCFRVYKDADAPCSNCPVLATFEDGEVHTSEETVVTVAGQRADVVVTSAPIFNEQGDVVQVVEMFTNITQINELKKELARSRRDYKQLFETVPVYICVLDPELEIIERNFLYRQDFDATRGSHCYEVCKKRDSACHDCLVQRTFDDGLVHSSEETLTTRDGRELNLIVYSMPLRDEGGEITTVMEVFTDITEVKKLQRRLTLMGRAVAGMAHRIKNIMMGLEGSIFVVNTGNEMDDEEMVAEGWEMVERNVGRVSHLVFDLLYCAKDREPEFKADVCPQDVVKEVAALYRDRLGDEKIELELALDKSPVRGTFDTDGLQNMLVNLVGNAIDACRFDPDESKSSHEISLRCSNGEGGSVVFEVADNGSGIPDEVKEKVFEEFFSTKGTEGTGVGLLVVKKVTEEHGGQIALESEKGVGTSFRVTIPSLD